MNEFDRLKARVEALEAAVAGVDRDQADDRLSIRAVHHLVQALSITQAQQTGVLESLRTDVAALLTAVGGLQGDVAELRAGNEAIAGLIQQLIGREDGGD